jgi:GTPase SAR1 family protein
MMQQTFHISLFGSPGVGKSTFLNVICNKETEGKENNGSSANIEDYSLVASDYKKSNMTLTFKFQLGDREGGPQSDASLLLYDITNYESF